MGGEDKTSPFRGEVNNYLIVLFLFYIYTLKCIKMRQNLLLKQSNNQIIRNYGTFQP